MEQVRHVVIDILGFPAVLLGILFNLDNVNSLLLAILGLVYLALKIKGQMLDNKIKELDTEERTSKAKHLDEDTSTKN